MAIRTILRSLPIPTEIVPTERACSNNFSVGLAIGIGRCTFVVDFPSILYWQGMNNAISHAKKDPPFVFYRGGLSFDTFVYEQISDSKKYNDYSTVRYILVNANAKTFLCYS
jgi:hypothetical protein